jgi:hypothetical protein
MTNDIAVAGFIDADRENSDTEVQAVLARFEYAVPPWLKRLLDSALESMTCMDDHVIPNCDPDSDAFRDHFFMELVLRLAPVVEFESTASFLLSAIADDETADTPRHEAFQEAILAFLKSNPNLPTKR